MSAEPRRGLAWRGTLLLALPALGCDLWISEDQHARRLAEADTSADTGCSASEVCDGEDNDCDGSVDEGLTSIWYLDDDGDGFGELDVEEVACDAPSGFVDNGSDCDDSDADINPDALEICDGLDNDCDEEIDEGLDADLDGYSGCGDDCDDSDPRINPGAPEVCFDGIDNNCNELIDGEEVDCTTVEAPTAWVSGGGGCASCEASVAGRLDPGAGVFLLLLGVFGLRRRKVAA